MKLDSESKVSKKESFEPGIGIIVTIIILIVFARIFG